jgi:predicted unusual protein kinase regulating ubiquinone biosynthesis (AarF/ABC1/UbiB family)
MIVPFERPATADDPGNVDITFVEVPVPPPCDPPEGTREWRTRLYRRERVQLAADAALNRWRIRTGAAAGSPPVIQELPRPPKLGVPDKPIAALPPRRQEEVFQANVLRTIARLFVWFWGGLNFLGHVVIDKLLRRYSEQRAAVHLREAFERMGTTFIKVGQQLSMRLDLLPYAYTRELESMLDHVPPIDSDEAIKIIEEATHRPLNQLFSAFDRESIGSASIACVYQAVLHTGERVAVKVRRPGIGERLAADMRALGWIMRIAELIVVPPGFTANFMYELSTMLFEELDFVREARFTDLFRKKMRKTKQLHFATAPKVYFTYSSTNVLVTEFVSGIWMNELISAVESRDAVTTEKLRAMNIEPVILARRIQLVARFNNFENIFFHADIHPANILVHPGNRITLIDFGACGSFSKKELNSWRRWFDAQSVNDIGGMAQAALGIIEPVPPIDKDQFALRLESVFWNDLYAIKDKHSAWPERISARLWIGFLKLSREFNVPMRLNTLRMIRASMLADTIAARLDNDQDPYKEFRHYAKGAGRRAKKRTCKRLRTLTGPTVWTRLEMGIDTALKFCYQFSKTVDSLESIDIIPLIGKAAVAAILMMRAILHIGIVTTVFELAFTYWRLRQGQKFLGFFETYKEMLLHNYYYQGVVLFIILVLARQLAVRLHDRDKLQ